MSLSDASPESPAEAASSHALTTTGPSIALPMAAFGPEGAGRPDVIRGGMDPNSLFHSFRRRWLLALCMGLLAGAGAGVGLYFLFPESSSAIKMYRIYSNSKAVLGKDLAQEADFEIFRRTQAVLIKSNYVLTRALNEPGVATSPFFKGVEAAKRNQHLADELVVLFPQDSEVMQVQLSGSVTEEELSKIISAVDFAYKEEVLFQARIDRLKPRKILEDSLQQLNRKILRKTEQLQSLMKEQGDGFAGLNGEIDPETRLLTSEALQLAKESAAQKQRLSEIVLEYEEAKRLIQDAGLLEQRVDEAITGMPETQQREGELLYYKTEIRNAMLGSPGNRVPPAVRMLQERYELLNANFEQYKKNLRKRMLDDYRKKPNPELRLLTLKVQQQRGMIAQQVARAEERIDEITETLRARNQTGADLLMRKNEIEGLREVAASIALRVSQWDIEAGAENERIEEIPIIETKKGINTATRYAISGMGGLACFALTCFGIAYMEFCGRRLNGPEQIDEGLGIRVIGTLPGLPGGRAMDSRHPVVAQLTESIDSVRTALMHESTSKRRQIVMVTSAATMEGRTTVASHLAVSLARAGRRTLLIDGDLRGPALHNFFDVPLEDGLCEVLRAETDVADVVRPTHAEGLWLITAGYVDPDAVHALATDQVQPIFDKLRADYDFIIIDGAPILGLSDSLLFGQHCDGAILSVLRDHTAVPKIHQSAQLLKSVGVRLIGCVVNGVVTKADRRVTHLQAIAPKSAQKQLENAEA